MIRFSVSRTSMEAPSEREKLLLQYAAETRRFEIERFWQRTLFFWTVLGAAFVAYAALAGKDTSAQTLVACFGLVASVAWTLQNRGAKYWQEAWEQKTKRYQHAALATDLFSRYEPRLRKGWFGGFEFSVSRIAIMLSDFTVLIWLALLGRPAIPTLIESAMSYGPCTTKIAIWLHQHGTLLAVLSTLVWCVGMIWFGRSSPTGGERAESRGSEPSTSLSAAPLSPKSLGL